MSKTFTYVLIVIGVYVFIIAVNKFKEDKKDTSTKTGKSDDVGSGLAENKDKNGVSQGASGQMKYRIGARSTN